MKKYDIIIMYMAALPQIILKERSIMKKTRFLSMLLAVVLAISSLPVMTVSVVAAELESMETRESITIPTDSDNGWTGVSYVKDKYATFSLQKTMGFSKITLYTKASGDTDICQPGQTYTVSVDVRVAAGTTPSSRPSISVAVANATSGWEIYKKLESNDWYPLSKSLKIPASPTNDITMSIYHLGSDDRVKFDFRNITITDSNGNIVLNYGEATDNWSFPIRKTGDFIEVTDNSGLSADLTSATTASYDIADVKLLPGVYQLSGTFSTDADEASLGVKLGDAAMTVGATADTSATVGATAEEITYTLTVAEETTLSAINFDFAKDGGSAATKLMLGALKLTCVELTTSTTNASIKRGTTVAKGDSIAFWSSDTGAVAVDGSRNYVECSAKGGGNYFLTTVLYDPADPDNSICTPGTKYKITVNAIQSENNPIAADKTKVGIIVGGTKNYCDKYPVIPTDWADAPLTYDFTIAATEASKVQLKFMVPPGVCSDKERIYLNFRGIKIVDAVSGEVVLARGEYDETLAPSEWTFINRETDEKHYTNLSELMLTPDATNGSTFAYDATNKDITLTAGEYVVSAIAYAANGTQTVKVTAKAANGESATGTAYGVGANPTTVKMTLKVTETTKLSEVGLIVDGGSAIYLTEILIAEKAPEFVAPNVGIMMAFLLKKTGPNRNFKKTNFLEKICEDVGTEKWTYPEGRTLKGVVTDDISYLSMSNIQKNMDTFAYGYDYTLEPGTYNLTGLIRTTAKGQTSRARIAIGKTNVADISYGTEWTKINVTFDLIDSTDFLFKVYGGPWEGYTQPYELANLVLVDVNETPETEHILPWEEGTVTPEDPEEPEVVEPEEPEEEVVLKAVEGSLAPDVYNDVGSDKWDLGLEKYAQTLTVKSQGGNLYLAMRNVAAKTDEGSGFTYNTGITLEPGTYTLECDVRTAVKGEVGMVRTFVNGAVLKLDWINNEWTSFDATFVVTETTELVIHFAGGADVNFIKDFDVTGIKVVKQ